MIQHINLGPDFTHIDNDLCTCLLPRPPSAHLAPWAQVDELNRLVSNLRGFEALALSRGRKIEEVQDLIDDHPHSWLAEQIRKAIT